MCVNARGNAILERNYTSDSQKNTIMQMENRSRCDQNLRLNFAAMCGKMYSESA